MGGSSADADCALWWWVDFAARWWWVQTSSLHSCTLMVGYMNKHSWFFTPGKSVQTDQPIPMGNMHTIVIKIITAIIIIIILTSIQTWHGCWASRFPPTQRPSCPTSHLFNIRTGQTNCGLGIHFTIVHWFCFTILQLYNSPLVLFYNFTILQ